MNIYPEVPNGKNASKLNHILLTSESLQRTINCINNSNVTDEIIQWMGFSGKESKHRKDHFLRLLGNNSISYIYPIIMKNILDMYPLMPSGKGFNS